MNFTDVLIVAGITAGIVAPLSLLIAMFMFAVGLKNREEEAYRLGFEHGRKAKENDILRESERR